jgi:hypothetical protein
LLSCRSAAVNPSWHPRKYCTRTIRNILQSSPWAP